MYSELTYYICMKDNLKHYRTSVCNINYHMVWSVKYRRKVLTPEVEKDIKEILYKTAEDKGFSIVECEVGLCDHVHCFITAPPTLSISQIASKKLFELHPEIRKMLWNNCLWNHSYYVETVGSVSEDIIRKYIEHQEKAY